MDSKTKKRISVEKEENLDSREDRKGKGGGRGEERRGGKDRSQN